MELGSGTDLGFYKFRFTFRVFGGADGFQDPLHRQLGIGCELGGQGELGPVGQLCRGPSAILFWDRPQSQQDPQEVLGPFGSTQVSF